MVRLGESVWAAAVALLVGTSAVSPGLVLPAMEFTRQAAAQEPPHVMIDVRRFGAIAGDERDDRQQIQAAIDMAGPGATIRFPAGTYMLSGPVALRSFQKLVGEKGSVLMRGAAGAAPLMAIKGRRGITISGLTFKGGGIALHDSNRDIVITRNRFKDIFDAAAAFGKETGIFVAGPLDGGRITGNEFAGIGVRQGRPGSVHANGIYAYHLNDTEITDNSFKDVYQAISIMFEDVAGTGRGVKVAGNEIINPWRMGIEAQGIGAKGVIVERNFVRANFVRGGSVDKYAIGISITITHGFDTIIRDNVVVGEASYSGPCVPMGIEAAGVGTILRGNHVSGHWCALIGIYADVVQYAKVSGNVVCGHRAYDQGGAIDFYFQEGKSVATGNKVLKDCPASFPDSIKAARAAVWRR